jgi:hypothetical protein
VSKTFDAPYAPGNRGLWRKSKCLNRQEFVVVGWTDPEGSRLHLGALLLGYYTDDGKLIYAGRVGTGMPDKTLGDLASIDSASALRRRLNHYAAPALLVIDEVGYLSYSSRHADMLFELINRRYETKSTVVTTNRAFCDWHEVFPGAACVVSLVDRLVHNAEVIAIDGDSYRLKEATERADQRARQRRTPTA